MKKQVSVRFHEEFEQKTENSSDVDAVPHRPVEGTSSRTSSTLPYPNDELLAERWLDLLVNKPRLGSFTVRVGYKGFAMKRGPSNRNMFNWKKCFLLLQYPFLPYFASNDPKGACLGAVFLKDASVEEMPHYPGKKNVVKVTPTVRRNLRHVSKADDENSFYFSFSSPSEVQRWVQLMRGGYIASSSSSRAFAGAAATSSSALFSSAVWRSSVIEPSSTTGEGEGLVEGKEERGRRSGAAENGRDPDDDEGSKSKKGAHEEQEGEDIVLLNDSMIASSSPVSLARETSTAPFFLQREETAINELGYPAYSITAGQFEVGLDADDVDLLNRTADSLSVTEIMQQMGVENDTFAFLRSSSLAMSFPGGDTGDENRGSSGIFASNESRGKASLSLLYPRGSLQYYGGNIHAESRANFRQFACAKRFHTGEFRCKGLFGDASVVRVCMNSVEIHDVSCSICETPRVVGFLYVCCHCRGSTFGAHQRSSLGEGHDQADMSGGRMDQSTVESSFCVCAQCFYCMDHLPKHFFRLVSNAGVGRERTSSNAFSADSRERRGSVARYNNEHVLLENNRKMEGITEAASSPLSRRSASVVGSSSAAAAIANERISVSVDGGGKPFRCLEVTVFEAFFRFLCGTIEGSVTGSLPTRKLLHFWNNGVLQCPFVPQTAFRIPGVREVELLSICSEPSLLTFSEFMFLVRCKLLVPQQPSYSFVSSLTHYEDSDIGGATPETSYLAICRAFDALLKMAKGGTEEGEDGEETQQGEGRTETGSTFAVFALQLNDGVGRGMMSPEGEAKKNTGNSFSGSAVSPTGSGREAGEEAVNSTLYPLEVAALRTLLWLVCVPPFATNSAAEAGTEGKDRSSEGQEKEKSSINGSDVAASLVPIPFLESLLQKLWMSVRPHDSSQSPEDLLELTGLNREHIAGNVSGPMLSPRHRSGRGAAESLERESFLEGLPLEEAVMSVARFCTTHIRSFRSTLPLSHHYVIEALDDVFCNGLGLGLGLYSQQPESFHPCFCDGCGVYPIVGYMYVRVKEGSNRTENNSGPTAGIGRGASGVGVGVQQVHMCQQCWCKESEENAINEEAAASAEMEEGKKGQSSSMYRYVRFPGASVITRY